MAKKKGGSRGGFGFGRGGMKDLALGVVGGIGAGMVFPQGGIVARGAGGFMLGGRSMMGALGGVASQYVAGALNFGSGGAGGSFSVGNPQ